MTNQLKKHDEEIERKILNDETADEKENQKEKNLFSIFILFKGCEEENKTFFVIDVDIVNENYFK